MNQSSEVIKLNDSDFSSGKEQGMILSELCAMREALDRIERRIEGISKEVWAKIDSQAERIIKLEGEIKPLEKRLEDLESSKKWIVISIIGAVLTAMVNLVVKK